jgi:hypothetical protein
MASLFLFYALNHPGSLFYLHQPQQQ